MKTKGFNRIIYRLILMTAVLCMAFLFLPGQPVKAETLKSSDVVERQTNDAEAFNMIIGLAERCPYLGHVEGSFFYGGKTFVYIANNVHKTNKAEVYYSTCALEFSRQKNENKYKNTTGDGSDYYRYRNNENSISSVVICSPNFNEQAYYRPILKNGVKENASFSLAIFNDSFLDTKNYVKVASFVDSRMTDGTEKYVSTYFIISEDKLREYIETKGIDSWKSDFTDIIKNNPDNEDYYWLKMNKIMTTHSEKGFVSCVTNYTVQEENTKLITAGNPSYTPEYKEVASVHTIKEHGALGIFDELCVKANGSKFTAATRTGVEKSWHQSVPIKLDPRKMVYTFYDVSGLIPETVWHVNADEYDRTVTGTQKNPAIEETSAYNLKLTKGGEGGMIINNLDKKYRLATPEEAQKYPPMKETHINITDIQNRYINADDDALVAKYTLTPAFDRNTYTPLRYMQGVFSNANFNIRSSVDNYTSVNRDISYARAANWWIPVMPVPEANSIEVKAVYYDVDDGKVVDTLSYTKELQTDKEFTFTLKQSDFDAWSRQRIYSFTDWNGMKGASFKVRYSLAMDASQYGKRKPMSAWDKNRMIQTDVAYDTASGGSYTSVKFDFSEKSDVWSHTFAKDTFKTAKERVVIYIPVKANLTTMDNAVVRFYDVNDPSHMLDITDLHKVNSTGAITYTPVNNPALTVSGTNDDNYLKDKDGSVWRIVFGSDAWGSNYPIAVWSTDKQYEKYNSAIKEANLVKLKNTEGKRRFWCNSNTVPVNGYKVTIFIPVTRSISDMDVHYVDVATGKLVGDVIKSSYDQEAGNARFMQNNCSQLYIKGTPDGVFYEVCTDASMWGSYAPIFGYGSSSYASVKYASALSSKHVDAVVKKEAKSTYSFSHSNGYLTGYVGLYIPVRQKTEDLVVHFVDVDDGKTVRTDSGTVSDGGASYLTDRKFTAQGKSYEVVLKSSEYGSYSPMFFWGTDPSLGAYEYSTCSTKADGKKKPSIDKTTSQATYSCAEGTLKDNSVLFIPVRSKSEIVIETYLIDANRGTSPELKHTATDTYDPDKEYKYSASASYGGGYILGKTLSGNPPTEDWKKKPSEWAGYCSQYYAQAELPDGTKLSPAESGSLTLAFSKGSFTGKVVLRIYYAKYSEEPEEEPEVHSFDTTGGTILKNPKTGDTDGDIPNTALLGMSTGDDSTAPDVYTYNYSNEFDIGKGIPTTEEITNGIEVDTWYGSVGVKSMEVHPSAKVTIKSSAYYKKYRVSSTTDVKGWRTDYSKPKKVEKVVNGVVQKDGSGNIIYETIYDEYYYTTIATIYHYEGYGEKVEGKATHIYDADNAKNKYGFSYISNINLYQLSNVAVMNKALGDRTVINYSNGTSIPFSIKINPVTSNGLNSRDEVTTGGFINTPLTDATALMKTHVNMLGDLDFSNMFEGVPYEYTMPDRNVASEYIDSDSVIKTYTVITDDRGYVAYQGYSEYVDVTKEYAAAAQAKEKAEKQADDYYKDNFQGKILLSTQSDSLTIKNVVYMNEKEGIIRKGAIPDDTNTAAPDKLTTYGKGTPKNPKVEKNTQEQKLPIPVDTENNYYGTKVSATYNRIAYNGGAHSSTVTLTIDDGERGDRNYEQAILVLDPSAINDKTDKMSVYRNNEPVLVHSPVIAPIEIAKDSTGATQNVNEIPYAAQLLLDKTYTVDFVWDPVYGEGSDYYFKKGYYEDQDEGYTKYVQAKYVRFPFPVFTCGGDGTSDTDMTYYPLKTTEISKDGTQTVRFTDWIKLKETAWEHFEIYVPTWAKTGYYDETADADRTAADRYDASIQVEVYANNATDTHNKREYKWNKNADVQKLIEAGIIDVTDITTYAATFSYPVQITGWIYGFELVATNDQTTYGGEDEDMMDNRYSFVGNRTDMKVGSRNRAGGEEVRYTYGEDTTTDWPWKYTLPITTGKSTLYKTRGTMRLGTEFSFLMKTMLGDSTDAGDTYVEITPTFRYVTKDGTVYNSDQIEIYYDYINDKYLQYGSAKDTEKTASLDASISSDWFYDAQRFMADSTQYTYGDTKNMGGKTLKRTFGQYLNTWLLTAGKFGMPLDEVYKRKANLGTLSKLKLDSRMMLFSGSETELEKNLAENGATVARIPASESYENDFRSSMQTWYGIYRIPHDLYVLRKDRGYDTLADYFKDNAWLEDWRDVFETDGYLVLNFDITVYEKKNGTLIPTLSYHKAALDMWERENDGLTSYTAYEGYWGKKDVDYTVDGDGFWHSKNEVTIQAESGDIAVITRTVLGSEGGDEKQPGMLWINQ